MGDPGFCSLQVFRLVLFTLLFEQFHVGCVRNSVVFWYRHPKYCATVNGFYTSGFSDRVLFAIGTIKALLILLVASAGFRQAMFHQDCVFQELALIVK